MIGEKYITLFVKGVILLLCFHTKVLLKLLIMKMITMAFMEIINYEIINVRCYE